jgi:hypothetical protein
MGRPRGQAVSREVHVVPINDARPHIDSVACPCKPMRDKECPFVVVHNAWDRREIVERIEWESREASP